ncbi:MAG: RNA polymerase sigma factor [Bacteroidetes bacterium]|nr:RNA polymerase sigma factor [Bacteroidota bacterium]
MFFRKNPISFDPDDLNSIINACISNDAQAQKLLIKQYYGYSKSICLRYSSIVEDAEEIINDGFLKVFSNLKQYQHTQSFKGWIRRIMINTAIDYYRKNQKYQFHEDVSEMEIVDINEGVLSKISANEILKLIQQLPNSYRMVFTLFVIDGYSHKEIGDMLGIREGTSKSNLRDARAKLQLMIKNNYPHLYLAYGVKSNKVHEN